MITAAAEFSFNASDLPRDIVSESSFEKGLKALLVLNVFDASATMAWIYGGLADEANPLMASAIEWGPWPFVLSKLMLVSLAVLLLWRHREQVSTRLALIPMALLYAYVCGGHVGFFFRNLLEVTPPTV